VEIRRYLAILRRWVVLVVLIVAAALAAGWAIAPRGHTYSATSIVYVGQRTINIAPTGGQVSGDYAAGLDRLISTFTAMVPTTRIAAAAVASAHVARGPEGVVANTAAKQVPATDLITITYTDSDPHVTQTVDNALANALVAAVPTVDPTSGSASTSSGQVLSVYQPASLPTVPNHKGTARDLILAGLFGVIVAGCLVALLEYLDITLRSPEQVERQLELPVLGVVPALGARLPVRPATSSRTGLPPGPARPASTPYV
jgi:capsular polysaccharide biosynthesis protein